MLYSGGFFDPEAGRWALIATFRAPDAGPLLGSPHSFVEDWLSDAGGGARPRECDFGPPWMRDAAGWRQCQHGAGSSGDSRLPPGYLNRHIFPEEGALRLGVRIGGHGDHHSGTALYTGGLRGAAVAPAPLRCLPGGPLLPASAGPFAAVRLALGRYVVDARLYIYIYI